MTNNTAIAAKSSRRRLTAGQILPHISIWRRARKIACLAFAPLMAALVSSTASAQTIHIAGQDLIDLSVTRGLGTNIALTPGETNVIQWTNFGILGGEFDAASNSVYAITGINPPLMTNYGGLLTPASPNGRMMVANFSTPAQLQGHVPYSVECWFYEVSFSASPDGVFGWTLSAPPAGDAGIFSAANIAADAADGNNLNWTPGGASPTLGAWHYGVLTYDGTTENAYLDGVLSNSAVVNLHFAATNAAGTLGNPSLFSYLIAIPATSSSSRYNGAIASLRVHSDALSAADVANNFAAGVTIVPAPVNLSVAITNVTAISGTAGTANSGKATLNAVIQSTLSPSSTSLTFLYDTTDHGRTTNGWAHSVTVSAPQSVGPVSANVTGLTNGATYYVRAYTTDSADTNITAATSFTTFGPPVVVDSSFFFSSPGSDYLIGNLALDGDGSGQAYVILYYGTTDGGTVAGNWANTNQLGSTPVGAFNYQVSGLTTLSNYYFRYLATNAYGASWASASFPFQEGLMFNLNTTNLPGNGANVTTYPSSTGTLVYDEGTFSVMDFGGQKWLNETTTPVKNMWLPFTAFPGGTVPTSTPVNGATITAAFKPEAPVNTTWGSVANVFFSQIGIAVDSASDDVAITGNSVASVAITAGGSNYTSAPTVMFAPPGGIPAMDSTATGTAQISAAGVVTNVIITSGGTGYPWLASVVTAGTLRPPTITFSGGGGSNAAATATLAAATGTQLLPEVNSQRPPDDADGMNVDGNGNGRNQNNRLVVPFDQVSVVSVVAGDGRTSGVPGDNNYRVYVNGIEVMDSDYGYVTGVSFTTAGSTNGTGYTNAAGANVAPTVTFSAPTAASGVLATAAGVAVMGTGANLGHISSITITSPGSGYTGTGSANNATVTISPSPFGVSAVGTVSLTTLGGYTTGTNFIGAPATGENGGGMTQLVYDTPSYFGTLYGANATFNIGNDGVFGDGWTYTGYLGNVSVYGEALSDTARQAVENAVTTQAAPTTPLTYSITYTTDAHGTITPNAYVLNSSAGGVSTVYEGENQTYTFAAANGYGILLSVDGATAVSVSPGSTYTFSNVNANHTLALTSIAIPPQTVTVTYSGNGTVSTNGTVIPSGTAITGVQGGSTLIITMLPGPGYKIGPVTLNGTTVAASTVAAGVYAYANVGLGTIGTNDTVNITFSAFPNISLAASHVPESQALLFGVDTGSLPQTNGVTITNWPLVGTTTTSTSLVKDTINTGLSLAQTYTDAQGVIWENNIDANAAATTCYQLYPSVLANGTTIPNTGGTIITVVSPNAVAIGTGTTTTDWHSIVDVFFGCLEIGVAPTTGQIQAYVDNDQSTPYDGTINPIATSTLTIPNGTNAVLSLVAQPDGSFAVYYNTVLVITNVSIAGPGGLYLQAGREGQSFAANVTLGDDGPDSYNAFNGLIGNTYVWTTALTMSERTNLEVALMTEFHAVVPPNYNWIGANNANFSAVSNWTNTVPYASNGAPTASSSPIFSFGSAGQTVNLDTPETLTGLVFNTNAIISSAVGNGLTLGTGTAGSIITLSNSSGTIDVPITGSAALNVAGTGSLTVTNSVTLGATANGMLEIASGTSNSVVYTQTGGTLTTFSSAQNWTTAAIGPGIMLGGAGDTGVSATYNLNGGIANVPSIGCVTSTGAVLVPPSTYGATAILNLNGGVIQSAASDLSAAADARAFSEGSAHLIFNTTHTYIGAGGAKINTVGFSNSIAVPLEHYPNGPEIDGGLTLTGAGGYLALLSSATYTGLTKVQSGTLTCMATNSIGGTSLDVDDTGVLFLNFTGTAAVYQLTINGGAPLAAGTYGATGSGAANIDNTHFSGTGTVTVIGAVTTGASPKFTSTALTGGNLVLGGTGGKAGGQFLVLGSTNVAANITNWATIATGTFSASGFSVSIPVIPAVPQEFIQIVVP